MLKGMISSISTGVAGGGTVDGDLVVTGDFKVEGAGSFTYDEIIEGSLQVNAGISFSGASYLQDVGNNYLKLKGAIYSPLFFYLNHGNLEI